MDVQRALRAAAVAATAAMRAELPRGRLRSSIRAKADSAETRVPYAWFVQWGTRHMHGKHFVEPGIAAGIEALHRDLARGA